MERRRRWVPDKSEGAKEQERPATTPINPTGLDQLGRLNSLELQVHHLMILQCWLRATATWAIQLPIPITTHGHDIRVYNNQLRLYDYGYTILRAKFNFKFDAFCIQLFRQSQSAVAMSGPQNQEKRSTSGKIPRKPTLAKIRFVRRNRNPSKVMPAVMHLLIRNVCPEKVGTKSQVPSIVTVGSSSKVEVNAIRSFEKGQLVGFLLTLLQPKSQSKKKLQDRGAKLDGINGSIFTSIDACVMCDVL